MWWPPTVGRSTQTPALNWKNALLASGDEGGATWAIIASLIETNKLNGGNPYAWLDDTLEKLVTSWPQSSINELMPSVREIRRLSRQDGGGRALAGDLRKSTCVLFSLRLMNRRVPAR